MSEGESKPPLKKVGVGALFVGALALFYWSWAANVSEPLIERGRYCIACKQATSTDDYLKDYPKNWRRHPQGGDTGLVCASCNKGVAFLTADCETCQVVFLVDYLPKYDNDGNHVCPKCDAAYGKLAASKGVDLMPKLLNPGTP